MSVSLRKQTDCLPFMHEAMGLTPTVIMSDQYLQSNRLRNLHSMCPELEKVVSRRHSVTEMSLNATVGFGLVCSCAHKTKHTSR